MATKPDLFSPLVAALGRDGNGSSDFDLNVGVVLPPNRKLRAAGVLVPIYEDPRGLRLILTKRSSALKHHPGQIAFPGGKVDDGDAGVVAAALREAHEEIGLPPDLVEVLGTMPGHETVTGFAMTPVLGRIRADFVPVPEIGEVDEVFSVPLNHVTEPARYSVQSRIWRGQRRYYYAVPFGPYYIWGATARILRGLADRMSQ